MTTTNYDRRAVGTFVDRSTAERALQELQNSGFPMDRVSIIAKDQQQGQMGGADIQSTEAQEGAGAGAVAGTVLGGVGGLLVGLGALAVPGVGPFLAAGTIATTLAGAGIGAASGGLIGALTGLGIPEDQARMYNDRLEQGEYLVMVDGSDAEIRRAESILNRHNVHNWGTYNSGSTSGMATGVDSPPGITDTERRTIDRDRMDQPSVEVVDRRTDRL